MKCKVKIRFAAFLLCAGLLSGFCVSYAAAPAPSTVHADYWKGGLSIDGAFFQMTGFLNAEGKRVPLFSYNGTVYMPLRTVGEWMGKQVEWDGGEKAVRISGESDAAGRTLVPYTEAEEAAWHAAMEAGMDVQLRPDIQVVVDGTPRQFANALGEAVHPAAWNGSVYLPLRSVGELMGKNVLWTTDEYGGQKIFLNTPVGSGEKDSLAAFLTAAVPLSGRLNGLVEDLYGADLSDTEAGRDALNEIKAVLDQLAALPKPQASAAEANYAAYLQDLGKGTAAADAALSELADGKSYQDVAHDKEIDLHSTIDYAAQGIAADLSLLQEVSAAL